MSEGAGLRSLKVVILVTYFAGACLSACNATPSSQLFNLGSVLSPDRWKRQVVKCSSGQFTCKNGVCIDSDRACDGREDCEDKSDETAESCLNAVVCPSYAYHCAYGGCVDTDARCNGVKDCADNSDEKGCPGTGQDTPKCRDTEFECRNGQCIDSASVCDGVKDCNDGSDETRERCNSVNCPTYSFKCNYGACIDGDGRCNGMPECADGSDESPDLCKPTPEEPLPAPPGKSCKLPPYPKNGKYSLGGCDTPSNCPGPGASLDAKLVLLTYQCDAGFNMKGNNIVYCQSGTWSSAHPICESVRCPPVVDPSLDVTCTFQKKNVQCNKSMQPGTEAVLKCKMYYSLTKAASFSKIRCLPEGKWNREAFKCSPECGKRNPEGVPFITGGYLAKSGEYPWHVGVYRSKGDKIEQICGGSLISPTLIVSAAHCFYDESKDLKYDISEYKIAAGKDKRDWDEENKYLQRGKIKDIILEERYRGTPLHYANDIAVVVLEVALQMTLAVRIVCIDWQNKYDERTVLSDGNVGVVVGWGITEGMIPSERLMVANLPYRSFPECYKEVPDTFRPFLTMDKFCAGHRNGTSVCPGDSGGGLSFKQKESDEDTWYLRGIVSVGVQKGIDRCFPQQYTAFTKVSDYYEFLNRYM